MGRYLQWIGKERRFLTNEFQHFMITMRDEVVSRMCDWRLMYEEVPTWLYSTIIILVEGRLAYHI